jgi:hypothetical protein
MYHLFKIRVLFYVCLIINSPLIRQNKNNRPLHLPREFHVRPGWRQTKQYNIVLVMNIAEALSN